MLFIIFYVCLVQPLCASGYYSDPVNWENASNSCNLTIFNVDLDKGAHSSKIWQPFVQITTYPVITKGCHNITSPKIESSKVIEHNNITNCYHFCWFGQTNGGSKIKAFLMKGNSCFCLVKSLIDIFDTAVKCPGQCFNSKTKGCDGLNSSSYAVYEIDDTYNLTANQIAGCGSVNPAEKKAYFINCSEERGAYCTALENVDGTQLKQDKNMTWDDANSKCAGHLASLSEISSVQSQSEETDFPSSRFWVGHRIWSYINYQFDPNLLSTSVKCGFFNPASGNIEFGSCMENKLYECREKDSKRDANIEEATKQENVTAPNQTTKIVIGGIAGSVTVLAIVLIIIYFKRKNVKNVQQKPEASELQLIEKPKQPVYDETNLENDYDHLHEHQDTHTAGDVNVYDVSRPCADVTNIGEDIYHTSKDFDSDKTYDYSAHSNLSKVDNTISNSDQYGTVLDGT